MDKHYYKLINVKALSNYLKFNEFSISIRLGPVNPSGSVWRKEDCLSREKEN